MKFLIRETHQIRSELPSTVNNPQKESHSHRISRNVEQLSEMKPYCILSHAKLKDKSVKFLPNKYFKRDLRNRQLWPVKAFIDG